MSLRSLPTLVLAATLLAIVTLGTALSTSSPADARTAQFAEGAGERVLLTATFEGRSGHRTSGTVRLVERDGRTLLELGEDFRFDGAPDPKLGFGPDGEAPGELFARLQSRRGEQVYALPAGSDYATLEGLNLWCERFGVPLGYATFR